jgi:hypothetical protein
MAPDVLNWTTARAVGMWLARRDQAPVSMAFVRRESVTSEQLQALELRFHIDGKPADSKHGLALDANFMSNRTVRVLSPRAVDCLGDLLVAAGDLHLVGSGHSQRYLYRVTRSVDALDLINSQLVRMPDGTVAYALHHVLRTDVTFPHVAVLAGVTLAPTLVDATFMDAVRRAGLTGFECEALQ